MDRCPNCGKLLRTRWEYINGKPILHSWCTDCGYDSNNVQFTTDNKTKIFCREIGESCEYNTIKDGCSLRYCIKKL